MTNIEEQNYLNYRFRGGAMSALTNAYVGLFTLSPGETGGGVEVSGGGYSRVTMSRSDWSAPSAAEPTTISNAATKSFGRANAAWGTIVAIGIFDARTGGTLLFFQTLSTGLAVNRHDTVQFNPATLKIGLA